MTPPSTNDLPPGLVLVHGNQPEQLRDLIVAWMARHPLAPLEPEVVLVQSNGIAQWLRLALAADPHPGGGGGCGIAAALDLSLPSRFLWRIYRAVLGADAVPEVSPFDEGPLVWRLMRLLPGLTAEAGYAPLARFLARDTDGMRTYQLALRLADLFDQYQVYRADWLAAWAAGDDLLIDARGARSPLPEAQRWQAALWRALIADIAGGAQAAPPGGRAAVHAAFCAAVAGSAPVRPPGVPRRVIVFGISSLPRQSLEVLTALARWSQVLLAVHNPCQYYWADLIAGQDLLRATARRPRRAGAVAPDPGALPGHPLLAAWGKQGRDYIALIDELESEAPGAAGPARRIDLFVSPGGPAQPGLLHRLQDDILELRPAAESRAFWPPLDPARDPSVRFHVCHSAQREVEVLHDTLLAAFAADPTLTPRDVIVMVPDIDTYAPHIRAVFGLVAADDPRHIPFSIADLGRRHHDPLLAALEALLALPEARLGVSEVLDLLGVPALRARFGIAADDLPRLSRWIESANIRWGFSAAHRAALGLPGAPEENTWRFGLRRLLLGYAAGDGDGDGGGGDWNGIEPCPGVGGLDAALLGPLARLLDRLETTWARLAQPATVPEWGVRLGALLADFFAPETPADAYTLANLGSALERWQETCADAGFTGQLPLPVVAAHWLSAIEGGGLGQRFLAGAVTFATLMPMRAIPFRRVCLLGMNDGDYPRTRAPVDFDLMAADYRPGDRSRREDDRYLFLEALLAARDHLHLSWVGRSQRDNSVRAPSVLVGQLRDHLAAVTRLPGHADDDPAAGAALLAALTVDHRLQPFAPEYFVDDGPDARLYTYAREWRSAPPAARSVPPLPERLPESPLTLAELTRFLRDPVGSFFQQRLRVRFDLAAAGDTDHEPFALDGLARWQLQEELIGVLAALVRAGEAGADEARLGEALAAHLARIRRRGELPAAAFATLAAADLAAPLPGLFARHAEACARWPWPADPARVELGHVPAAGGPGLRDWLDDLRCDDAGARARVVIDPVDVVTDGRYRGDRVLRHWLPHLLAAAAGQALTTEILSKVGGVVLAPVAPEQAAAWLDAVLAAWRAGQQRPLPLAVRTAFAWLGGGDAREAAARQAYEGAGGERERNPYLRRAYPDADALFASGEFADLAETLYRPLAAAMPVARGKTRRGAD